MEYICIHVHVHVLCQCRNDRLTNGSLAGIMHHMQAQAYVELACPSPINIRRNLKTQDLYIHLNYK